MSASDFKKQHERFLLDQFFEALDVPLSIVEERENPDFLVCLDGRKVGVELTFLFISHQTNGHLPQAHESISDRIVLRAQCLYQESSAPPVRVGVCFSPDADLKALNRDRSAAALSTVVRNLNLGLWQSVNWCPHDFDEEQLPAEISFVHALGIPSYEMAHWFVGRAGWAAPLTIEVLQSRIDEKSKKLSKYQKVVDENWLIVVSDGTKPSQLFSAPNFDPSQVTSPFSRTYYYGYPDRELTKLGA